MKKIKATILFFIYLTVIKLMFFSNGYSQNITTVFPKNNSYIPYDTITFAWNQYSTAQTYELIVSTDPDFITTYFTQNNLTLNSKKLNNLPTNIYYWKVRYYDGITNSDWSSPSSFNVYTPSSISGCIYQLVADSVKQSSNIIDTVFNRKSNAYHCSQANAVSKPLLVSNTINNRPVIRFDGTNDFLNGTGSTGDKSKYSFFIVCRPSDFTDFRWIYQNSPINTNSSFSISTISGSKYRFWPQGGSSAGMRNFDTLGSMTQFSILSVINNNNLPSNKASLYQNGFLNGQSSTNTLTHSFDGYKIGTYNAGSDFFKGDIAELIFFDSALTANSQFLIENYLRYKYFPTSYVYPVNLGYDIITDKLCDTVISAQSPIYKTYLWSDNSTGTSITVSNSGKYWVRVTDIYGITSSDTIIVQYNGHQTFRDTTLCIGDTLIYTYNRPFSYAKNWSNGDTSSIFKTAIAGTYTLTLTDSLGCIFTTQFIVNVDSFPLKNILNDNTLLCMGNRLEPLNITGITNFLWMPGNDTTNYKNIYSSNKYYLTTTNISGCINNDSSNVSIQGVAPSPLFQWSNPCNRDSIEFTNLSYPSDSIASSLWSINNGFSSSVHNPKIVFDTAGQYQINLQIESYSGCKNDTTITITIKHKPVADYNNLDACANNYSQFYNTSNYYNDTALSNNWYIESNLVSSDDSPLLLFSNPQIYPVKLVIVSSNTCTDSITKNINVPGSYAFPKPFTTIYPLNNSLLSNSIIQFKWNSSENAQYYIFELSKYQNFSSVIHREKILASDSPLFNYILNQDTTYYWRIFAINPCNDSISSNISKFTLFNPLPSYLKFWLNADSCKISNINKIDTIFDLSGNNFHAYQSTASKRPQFKTNVLNGKPSIDFNGTQFLNGNGLVGNLPEYSFFIICRPNSFTNFNWIYQNSPIGSSSSFSLSCIAGSKYRFWAQGGSSAGAKDFDTLGSTSKFSMLSVVNNNALTLNKTKLYFNGNLNGTSNENTLTHGNIGYKIGTYYNESDYFNGEILEIILCNRELETTERVQIEKFLTNKYAPPVSLGYDIKIPYKLCDTLISAQANHFTNYLWNTGDTTSSIHVNQSGSYWVRTTNIFGQLSSDTIQITFSSQKTIPDSSICVGNNFQYNWTPLTNYTLSWSNGDNGSLFTETEAGSYHFTLTDTLGCTYRDTFNLFVDSLALRMSLGNDISLCGGNTLHFTLDNYTLYNPEYLWSTGNTSISTEVDSTHNYWLQITNSRGCIARDTVFVSVRGKAPIVSFSAPGKCLGESTPITDLSYSLDVSVINQWQWNFGDGNNSTSQNPTHNYALPGIYPITLIITTDSNCSNTTTIPTVVYTLPEVNFTPQVGCSNTLIQFTDQSQYTDNYTIDQWQWNFGDIQSGSNNQSILQHPNHSFDTSGTYSVKLRATSIVGCTDSTTKTITIRPAPAANFVASNTCEGKTTWFNDSTTTSIWNPVMFRTWIFEDETSSTEITTNRKYLDYGSYPVTYIVTSLNGCIDTITKNINVYALPVANFTPNSFCSNEPIILESSSSVESDIITYERWKIGNNRVLFGSQVQLYLDSAANYPVQLISTSQHNCSDTVVKNITVKPIPQSEFTYKYDELSVGYNIQFINNTTGASSFEWYSSNGLFSTNQNPIFDFANEGTFPILLISRNDQSCIDSASANVLIVSPVMDISVSNFTLTTLGNYQQAQVNLINMSNRNITDLWITLQINDQQIRERWTGMIRPGEIIPYQFNTQIYTPSNENLEFGCIKIASPIFTQETNLDNNQICITLGEEFNILKLYPNPANEYITLWLSSPFESQATIRILTTKGSEAQIWSNQALQKGITQLKLPLIDLSNGLYIMEVEFNNRTERIKFNIIR